MATVLTIRLDDALHAELNSVARAQGTSVSELARRTLRALITQPSDETERPGMAEVPPSLSTYERHTLALLHRVLARLVDGQREDGDFNHQIGLAEILEHGYVAEYGSVFAAIDPELTARESDLVHDILEMFFHLEWSFSQLTEDDRSKLDPGVDRKVRFGGFDGSDRLESRLLEFARHLIADGKWDRLAPYFARDEHDGGNAHHRRLPVYQQMLQVFQPLWRQKVRQAIDSGSNDFLLSAAELQQVTDAAGDPDNRGRRTRDW